MFTLNVNCVQYSYIEPPTPSIKVGHCRLHRMSGKNNIDEGERGSVIINVHDCLQNEKKKRIGLGIFVLEISYHKSIY